MDYTKLLNNVLQEYVGKTVQYYHFQDSWAVFTNDWTTENNFSNACWNCELPPRLYTGVVETIKAELHDGGDGGNWVSITWEIKGLTESVRIQSEMDDDLPIFITNT